MNYEKKMERLKTHIAEHPTDYQAVISLIKTNSDRIASEIRHREIDAVRKIAEYRRLYDEECSQRDWNN